MPLKIQLKGNPSFLSKKFYLSSNVNIVAEEIIQEVKENLEENVPQEEQQNE